MDEAMSVLLPTLGLLVATTAVLLAARIWKAWKRPGSPARGSRRGRAAPGAAGSPPAEESPPRGPAAPGSPPYLPCGCGPGCGPCAAAARELRDLVAPLWPGVSLPRDSEMWQLSWEDLEQLLERGRLPCCASSSSSRNPHPSRSVGKSCQAPDGEDPTDGSHCSLEAAGLRSNCSALRMHVAKKNLEVKLRAQPVAVRRSQEQLVRREASPSSSESLLRSESLSGSCRTPDGDAAADSSPCSLASADICGARAALRMHVAKKSLEVKLGAQPAPVKSSQEQVQEGSWRRQGPSHGPCDAAVPLGRNAPCSESEKILQRQRELEFPHLQGPPLRRMRLLLAAQILLRMLCLK